MRGRYEDRQRWKGLNQAEVEATSGREKITLLSPAVPPPASLIPPHPAPPHSSSHDFLTYFSGENRLGRKIE